MWTHYTYVSFVWSSLLNKRKSEILSLRVSTEVCDQETVDLKSIGTDTGCCAVCGPGDGDADDVDGRKGQSCEVRAPTCVRRFVYTHDYRAVRTVQAAQPLYFVAASWLVVGTGEFYAVVEWIPAAM